MTIETASHDASRANSNLLSAFKWTCLGVFAISVTLFGLNDDPRFATICPTINAITFCGFSLAHCADRYGGKITGFFLLSTWIISCGLEMISVNYGFPFGLYSYVNAPPPIVLGVPVATGAVYFGMAYVSWMLANLLLGRSTQPIVGPWVWRTPVLAVFIMVMWDFVLDPVYATIFSVWVWPNGGPYFGVPLSNYAGWMFSAYVIFQLFAVYLARSNDARAERATGRVFWYELILAYFLQGFIFVLFPLSHSGHAEIFQSMGLAFVYTMLFVTLLSLFTVWRNDERTH